METADREKGEEQILMKYECEGEMTSGKERGAVRGIRKKHRSGSGDYGMSVGEEKEYRELRMSKRISKSERDCGRKSSEVDEEGREGRERQELGSRGRRR